MLTVNPAGLAGLYAGMVGPCVIWEAGVFPRDLLRRWKVAADPQGSVVGIGGGSSSLISKLPREKVASSSDDAEALLEPGVELAGGKEGGVPEGVPGVPWPAGPLGPSSFVSAFAFCQISDFNRLI